MIFLHKLQLPAYLAAEGWKSKSTGGFQEDISNSQLNLEV